MTLLTISSPGEGKGYPLQYSDLGDSTGCIVPRVAKSWTWLRDFHFYFAWNQSVQSFSHVQLFTTPWTAACQASLSITNSQSLLKLKSIESVMPSTIHLILGHPCLLLPSVFPSIRVFPNESVLLIRWPKYWSVSFSINPSNEYSWLISFGMDWLNLLAVQGTLKSLLKHRSSKASVLGHSALFLCLLKSYKEFLIIIKRQKVIQGRGRGLVLAGR